MGKPKIFLIEEDNDSRLLFRESLQDAGFKISLAIDEEDALERIDSGCIKADLVLINLLQKTIEKIVEIGRNICLAGKLNAPLIVIAQKYGASLEGKNVQISEKEYVAYLESGEQLLDLMSQLLAQN